MIGARDGRLRPRLAVATALATPAVANRFHVWLDYASFRGFFMVGVGAQDFGDFGFAYDDHPRGFYDLGGTNAQGGISNT